MFSHIFVVLVCIIFAAIGFEYGRRTKRYKRIDGYLDLEDGVIEKFKIDISYDELITKSDLVIRVNNRASK